MPLTSSTIHKLQVAGSDLSCRGTAKECLQNRYWNPCEEERVIFLVLCWILFQTSQERVTSAIGKVDSFRNAVKIAFPPHQWHPLHQQHYHCRESQKFSLPATKSRYPLRKAWTLMPAPFFRRIESSGRCHNGCSQSPDRLPVSYIWLTSLIVLASYTKHI